MIDPDDKLYNALQAALRYAALRDGFAPRDAVAAAEEAMGSDSLSTLQTARLLTELRARVAETSADKVWSLHNLARQSALSKADLETATAAIVEDSEIVQALRGTGTYSETAVDDLIAEVAALDTIDHAAVERLRGIVAGLDRAGSRAAAYPLLAKAVAALNKVEDHARSARLLRREFAGRHAELRRIRDWVASGQSTPPVETLFVTGLPGIGKSYLLDRAVAEARHDSRPIVLRLDFDRNGLTLNDADKIVHELSRQLGNSLPEHSDALRRMRLKYASSSTERSDLLPTELVDTMGEVVRASELRLILVLDTLEVLRGHGETHPRRLFELLDTLVERGVAPMAVLSAGRGDALDPVRKRIRKPVMELGGLGREEADTLLGRLGVNPDLFATIYDRSGGGHPLKLRLWARLSDQLDDIDDSEDITAAYLYRVLLSRIDDPLLRDLAHPGLILRRINADVIEHVLAPALGLADEVDADRAEQLWDALSRHHWLVDKDGLGWLSHRRDLRAEILPMLYSESPKEAAEIDRRAAEWFSDVDPDTALYHELQATRAGHPMPDLSADALVALSDEDLAELPDAVQELSNQAMGLQSKRGYGQGQGDSTSAGGGDETRRDADPVVIGDIEMALSRRDVVEAHFIRHAHDAFPDHADPRTPTGHVAMALAWASGRWSEATRLHRGLSDADRASYLADKKERGLYGSTVLEIEAERRFASFTATLRDDRDRFERAMDARRHSSDLALGGASDIALLMADHDGGQAVEVTDHVTRELYQIGTGRQTSADEAMRQAEARTSRYNIGYTNGAPFLSVMADGYRSEDGSHAIARLNPMTHVLNSLTMTRHSPTLAEYLEKLFDRLPRLMQFSGGFDRFDDIEKFRGSFPEEGPELLGALGLTTDWAAAFAVFHRVSDIGHVARAAERWRRFSGGRWAYSGPPPPGWVACRGPDPAVRVRVQGLMDEGGAIAAEELLTILAGDRDRLAKAMSARLMKPVVRAMIEADNSSDITDRALAIAEQLAARLYGPALASALGVVTASNETRLSGQFDLVRDQVPVSRFLRSDDDFDEGFSEGEI